MQFKKQGAFYKKNKSTFKTGPLDIAVTVLVVIVFLIAFFLLSWKALIIDGEIIRSERHWRETGDDRIPVINDFAVMGGLIMTYEAFLLTLEGRKRGKYLPWSLWYRLLKYKIHLKIQEGKTETREFLNRKKDIT